MDYTYQDLVNGVEALKAMGPAITTAIRSITNNFENLSQEYLDRLKDASPEQEEGVTQHYLPKLADLFYDAEKAADHRYLITNYPQFYPGASMPAVASANVPSTTVSLTVNKESPQPHK